MQLLDFTYGFDDPNDWRLWDNKQRAWALYNCARYNLISRNQIQEFSSLLTRQTTSNYVFPVVFYAAYRLSAPLLRRKGLQVTLLNSIGYTLLATGLWCSYGPFHRRVNRKQEEILAQLSPILKDQMHVARDWNAPRYFQSTSSIHRQFRQFAKNPDIPEEPADIVILTEKEMRKFLNQNKSKLQSLKGNLTQEQAAKRQEENLKLLAQAFAKN